jgi:hypothetical protein
MMVWLCIECIDDSTDTYFPLSICHCLLCFAGTESEDG